MPDQMEPIVVTEPGLGANEAAALAAMLGDPEREYTLRAFTATRAWLDPACGGNAHSAIDDLVDTLDRALMPMPQTTTGLRFSDMQHTLFEAAITHALGGTREDVWFTARFGIDRKRALHLRTALRLEHAIAARLARVSDPDVLAEARAMVNAAREMRRWRHSIYNSQRAVMLSPELNLLSDALNVAAGLPGRGFLQGSIEATWDKFEVDTQPRPPARADGFVAR